MTAKKCLMHIGMPKTGSSSIQQTLFYRLQDRRYQYLSFGDVSSDNGLLTLFDLSAKSSWFVKDQGWSLEKLRRLKAKYHKKLQRANKKVRQNNKSLILSGETVWRLEPEDITQMRDSLVQQKLRPVIIAYLRPPADWLGSYFQQLIKQLEVTDLQTFLTTIEEHHSLDFASKIRTFDNLFGRENVQIHLFDPKTFPKGCVVRHFLARQEIELDPNSVIHVNESLSFPAIQMLFSWLQLMPTQMKGRIDRIRRFMLISRMGRLPGKRICLSENAIADHLEIFEKQRPWLEQRLGRSIPNSVQNRSNQKEINDDRDLFRFSEESLNWLCRESNSPPIRTLHGKQAAQQVAERVDRLFRRPDPTSFTSWASEELGKHRKKLFNPIC